MSARKLLACFVASMLSCAGAFAQRSPFNGLEVLPADSTGHYRILIGGHFHGASNNRSGYPAATLLANLDTINAIGADLFLSTGDLFMDAEKDRARYERSFFTRLKMPLFNAPGNHDSGPAEDQVIRVGGWKQVLYAPTDPGPTVSWMEIPGPIVAVLNTERSDGSADSERIAMMNRLLEVVDSTHEETRSLAQVFVASHRPVWAEDDPQYADLFKDNTRSLTGTNFQKEVYPILDEIAKHAHIYWISGSLGGEAPSSIFFQEHAPNITYIQCAIRDEPRDALLIADVYPDSIHWSALSLTGQELKAPQTYDAAWWRAKTGRGEDFNWRLLPYYIRQVITHRAFWWGAACTLLLVFLVRRFLRR